MKKKPSRKSTQFEKMDARELAEATAPYGKEMVIDGGHGEERVPR